MLVEQFGDYIEDPRFKEAFDEAMIVAETLEIKHEELRKIDTFHLLQHYLIIDLFNRFAKIEMQQRRDSDKIDGNGS